MGGAAEAKARAAAARAKKEAEAQAAVQAAEAKRKIPFWERLGKHKPIVYANPERERNEFLQSIKDIKPFTIFGPTAHQFAGVYGVGNENTGGAGWGPTFAGGHQKPSKHFNPMQSMDAHRRAVVREARIQERQNIVHKARQEARETWPLVRDHAKRRLRPHQDMGHELHRPRRHGGLDPIVKVPQSYPS